jgi:hypothetical protein
MKVLRCSGSSGESYVEVGVGQAGWLPGPWLAQHWPSERPALWQVQSPMAASPTWLALALCSSESTVEMPEPYIVILEKGSTHIPGPDSGSPLVARGVPLRLPTVVQLLRPSQWRGNGFYIALDKHRGDASMKLPPAYKKHTKSAHTAKGGGKSRAVLQLRQPSGLCCCDNGAAATALGLAVAICTTNFRRMPAARSIACCNLAMTWRRSQWKLDSTPGRWAHQRVR